VNKGAVTIPITAVASGVAGELVMAVAPALAIIDGVGVVLYWGRRLLRRRENHVDAVNITTPQGST
jgi:hypothetical protein